MILPAGLNLTKAECLYFIQHASHLTLFHFTTTATDAKAGTLGTFFRLPLHHSGNKFSTGVK
jgi:hypothetical protein